MGSYLGTSGIIAGLFISALLAYLLTRANRRLGAWVTVAAPFAALAALILLRSEMGSTGQLLFLQFRLTEYGWFFSVIMLAVFGCVSFFNIFWMDKLAQPAAYNLLYLLPSWVRSVLSWPTISSACLSSGK